MLCVLILHVSGGTYSLKSTPNDRFFEKRFHGNFFYLFPEFLPEIGGEEVVEEIFSYFFYVGPGV